jgi:3-hydroxyisobutyrate dehydrogenase-like beta-hydroxyacid dehydrogenase
MSALTMIGLGAMGSALARAFLGAGHDVTMWNRTPQRMAPLVAMGAAGADSLLAAIAASPVAVICIDSYAATTSLIGSDDVLAALSGRTLIQLSTGAPREARESEAWLKPHGIDYIDGAIMPYPEGIGEEDAQILFAGPQAAYARCEHLLSCLGGDVRYLGPNIAAAAALDMALLSRDLGSYRGSIHGAHACEAEGVDVATYASLFPDSYGAKRLVEVIHAGAYADPGATISVWDGAVERIRGQAVDAGINSEVPDFIASFIKRAIAAGHGEEDIAALIKVLRT